MNVDDETCDSSYEWIERLFDVAVAKLEYDHEVNIKFDDVPEDIQDSWYDKFWDFDITTWTPRTDDRAFPDTYYGNKFYDIFEFNSYELVSDMLEYLEPLCRELTKEEMDEKYKDVGERCQKILV